MNIAVTTHLREVRKSKGLTQKEVAEALLISKDSLSRYERGEQDPRLDVAIRLIQFITLLAEEALWNGVQHYIFLLLLQMHLCFS